MHSAATGPSLSSFSAAWLPPGKLPARFAIATLSLLLSGCPWDNDNDVDANVPTVNCNTQGPGALSFSSPTYSVAESGAAGTATITVTRAGGCQGAASVQASTSNGTTSPATAGADYTAVTNLALSWPDGDSAARTFTVAITNDTLAEASETINLALATPTGATLAAPTSAVLTITDDSPGTLQFSAASYSVAENGAGTATITVTRTGGAEGPAHALASTANGTATAGSDYTAVTNRSVDWVAGDATAQTFSIAILPNDSATEGSETVNLAFSGVTGATLGAPGTAILTITDSPGTLQFSTANFSGAESTPATSATISVTRAGGNGGAVGVAFATVAGGSASAADFTSASGTLAWVDGDTTPKTFTVAILDDALIDPGETVNLALSAATGGAGLGTPGTATLTITDNDTAQLQFSSATYTVNESGTTATITVTRSGVTTSPVSVQFATRNGATNPATAGSDYTATSGTLSFASGEVSKTFPVSITNDSVADPGETIALTLSNPASNPAGGAFLGTPSTATLTITDDPAGTVQLSATTYTVAESGAGTATITATRTGGSEGSADLNFATGGGTATAGTDYTAISGTMNWPAGDNAPKSFDIFITPDSVIEGSETVNLTVSGATGASLGTPASAVLTITDSPGTLNFSVANFSGDEASGTAVITVLRFGGNGGAASVNFATVAGGSATAGADFTSTSGTRTWADGDTAPKTFTVAIANDNAADPNETVNLLLSGATGASLGGQSSATITITDDPAGKLQFSAAAYSVAENGGGATITVTRIGGSAAASVNFATGGGTATAGADYTASSGTLNWGASDGASKTFTVAILNDALLDPGETVGLTLSGATGAALGAPTAATLTINDDDSPGALRFSSASVSVSEDAGAVTLTVQRTGGSAGAVAVNFASAPGTATAPADYPATSGTLNWAAGDAANKTIRVSIVSDGLAEAAESFTVTLSGPTGGATLGTPVTATVTITDALQASPRDYLLPYGEIIGAVPNDCCDSPPFSRIDAVRSDDFTQPVVSNIAAGAADHPMVIFTGEFSGNVFRFQRPLALVYHNSSGRWFRVNLRTAVSHAPAQISSELAATICQAESDFPEASGGGFTLTPFIFYKVPGGDAACDTADDQIRVIRANDAATTAPVALPAGTTEVLNTFVDATNGQLREVLVIQNNNLVNLDANFANPVTLKTNVGSVAAVAEEGINGFLYGIGQDLFRVSLPGTGRLTISASLLTIGAGESYNLSNGGGNRGGDATNLYFNVETPAVPGPGNPTNTRLFRIRRDGSEAQATPMFSFAGPMRLADLTTNKVIVVTTSNAGATQSLLAVAKTAANGTPAPLTLDTTSSGFIQSDVAGDKVFYTVQTFSATRTTTAKISAETGGAALATFANAAWVGRFGEDSFDLSTGVETQAISHFMLADGPSNFNGTNFQGAVLRAFKVADSSTTVLLAAVPDNALFFNAFGRGSARLGSFLVDPGLATEQLDVYAVDPQQNRFQRMTNTATPVNELPVGGD